MEKCHNYKVQALCKISDFTSIKRNQPRNLDRVPLKSIVTKAKEIVSLMTNLLLSVGLIITSTSFTSHPDLIKLVTILIIICKLAHQNNSNYLFFVAIYLMLLVLELISLLYSIVFVSLFYKTVFWEFWKISKFQIELL